MTFATLPSFSLSLSRNPDRNREKRAKGREQPRLGYSWKPRSNTISSRPQQPNPLSGLVLRQAPRANVFHRVATSLLYRVSRELYTGSVRNDEANNTTSKLYYTTIISNNFCINFVELYILALYLSTV